VSMYVGIAIIEATPLVEAMMVPLIHNGAHKYETCFNDALQFYRNASQEGDSEDPDDSDGELRWRGHGAVWEFWKEKEWIAYELDHQASIESAYTSGKKEISIQISTERYKLNWEGALKYQINEKTKSVRKIRRKPPPSKEGSREGSESPEGPRSHEGSKKSPDCSIC